jgi:phosphoadenosine phosphosulfate reductase
LVFKMPQTHTISSAKAAKALSRAISRAKAARALMIDAIRDHGPVTLASSMGVEDMVLVDLIATNDLGIDVFVLDTGRLHTETLALVQQARARYGIDFKIYVPDTEQLQTYLASHGPDGIFNSIDTRKTCCAIRKVEPLGRALKGYGAWVTGMRRDQSVTRLGVPDSEWDEPNGLHKYNPLANWSSKDVWAYIDQHKVPHNPLHKQGYPSIGCTPCTRAINEGEDDRAGRWWWENPDTKECGLHPAPTKSEVTKSGVSS